MAEETAPYGTGSDATPRRYGAFARTTCAR
jgi:hypothetical protein